MDRLISEWEKIYHADANQNKAGYINTNSSSSTNNGSILY